MRDPDLHAMLDDLDLEWGERESAEDLIALLSEVFTAPDAASFLLFYDPGVDGTPLDLLQHSSTDARRVFKRVREMAADVSSSDIRSSLVRNPLRSSA